MKPLEEMTFEKLCAWLMKMPPENQAFMRRLVDALDRDADGHLKQRLKTEGATLRRLLKSDDITGADRWLRRSVMRIV